MTLDAKINVKTQIASPAAQPPRLGSADSAPGASLVKGPLTHDQQVEQQARTWVAQTFFGTLLKQMRDSPFKSEVFSGGRGGEAFQQMFDSRLAMHMTRGVGSKLVRPLVKKLSKAGNANAELFQRYDQSKAATKEKAHVGTDRRA
ncbi:MAG: rod-binding protein [Tepidisphaeraceae bacterium]